MVLEHLVVRKMKMDGGGVSGASSKLKQSELDDILRYVCVLGLCQIPSLFLMCWQHTTISEVEVVYILLPTLFKWI